MIGMRVIIVLVVMSCGLMEKLLLRYVMFMVSVYFVGLESMISGYRQLFYVLMKVKIVIIDIMFWMFGYMMCWMCCYVVVLFMVVVFSMFLGIIWYVVVISSMFIVLMVLGRNMFYRVLVSLSDWIVRKLFVIVILLGNSRVDSRIFIMIYLLWKCMYLSV